MQVSQDACEGLHNLSDMEGLKLCPPCSMIVIMLMRVHQSPSVKEKGNLVIVDLCPAVGGILVEGEPSISEKRSGKLSAREICPPSQLFKHVSSTA